MAVQVIAYEVRMAAGDQEKVAEPKEETAYPLVDDLEPSMVTGADAALYRFYPRRPSGAGDE